MWNWRMLATSAQAQYADVMERALYNGINSGMSLDGTLYCYRNPLESRGEEVIREPWYDTTCCPPNLERTFAALPGYLYGTSPSGVYVNLYHSSTLDWHLAAIPHPVRQVSETWLFWSVSSGGPDSRGSLRWAGGLRAGCGGLQTSIMPTPLPDRHEAIGGRGGVARKKLCGSGLPDSRSGASRQDSRVSIKFCRYQPRPEDLGPSALDLRFEIAG